MRDTDYKAFEQALKRLFAVYPKSPVWGRDTVDTWFAVLEQYALEDVAAAMTRYLAHGRFAPTPADLVEILEGDRAARSLAAWTRVLRVVARHGHYRSVTAKDRLTLAVLRDLGGWPAFCERCNDARERPHLQREFERRHQEYQRHAPARLPDHLAGAFEQENRQQGYDLLPEGDPRRALVLRDLAPVDIDADPQPRPALPAPEPPAPERPATPEELDRAKRYVAQLLHGAQHAGTGEFRPAVTTD